MIDRPVQRRDDDLLGRWGLAKTIFDLIADSEKVTTLRVGVYGRWGEGKTSVLRLVEGQATRAGIPVCRFSVWAAQTQSDLWLGLIDALASLTGSSDWRTRLKTTRQRWFRKAEPIAAAHPLAQALHAAAGLVGGEIGVPDLQRVMNGLQEHRRIVVLVDDVDRVDSALVPKLLMGLHDIFDGLDKFAVILALDPDVVSGALGQLNPAWGSGSAFLDKIVQFPFWLSAPSESDRRRLLADTLRDSRLGLLEQPIVDLVRLLPHNPRRLKQFVRRMERLRRPVSRFGHDELSAPLLVILELLRAESPEAAEHLLSDAAFVRDLVSGGPLGTLEPRDDAHRIAASQAGRLDIAVARGLPFGSAEERTTLKTRLAAIVQAAEDALSFVSAADAQMHVAIDTAPPVMTLREADALHDQWCLDPTPTRLRDLLVTHAGIVERGSHEVLAATLSTALRRRGQLIGEASEAFAADDVDRAAARAARWLEMIEQLVDELGALNEPVVDRVALFLAIRTQTAQLANWLAYDAYAHSRERQRALLFRAAAQMRDRAPEVLSALKPWDAQPSSPDIAGAVELNETRGRLHALFEGWVAETIIERFTRPSGIAGIGTFLSHPAEVWLLTTEGSALHREPFRTALKDALSSPEPSVAENALAYLRLLVGSNGPAHPLVADPDLVVPLWNAATRVKPQPKSLGTMRTIAERIRSQLLDADAIAMPGWLSRDALPEESPIESGSVSPIQ